MSNVTLSLSDETIRKAKVLAAKRGMSMSALLAKQLDELTAADERYEHAKQAAFRAMAQAEDRGGAVASWSREELMFERWAR